MNFDPQNFGDFLDAYQHHITRQYAEGGDTQQAFMQQAVQAIASGQADAHDVFMQLQEMGMKQEQAATVVEQIMTAASQLKSQPQEPGMTGMAAYGGQLRQYEGTVGTGNVSEISDPYSSQAVTRTDHNMMSNVEDTALNQTFAGMNAMGHPNSMGWMLKDTGLQGLLKKGMGLAAVVGGAGLGIAKFTSPDKVTQTAGAPEGTMMSTDQSGQQTSISPAEVAKRKLDEEASKTTWQNKITQPANVASFGQPVDPTAWQKKIEGPTGVPSFGQPRQFGYGAEVDFDHMYLPQHQSNIGTGNVGPKQPFTFAGVPGNVTTNTADPNVSGIPYNTAGPMADGMNGEITPQQKKLDYLKESLDAKQTPAAPAAPAQPIPGGAGGAPETQTVTTKTRGDAGGIQAMSNTLNGLDMFNSTLGAGDAQREYKQRIRDAHNTDAMASTKDVTPFGIHTVNDQNAKGMIPNSDVVQDFGTRMVESGGDIHDFGAYLPHYAQGSDAEFAEGGEYELTEAQIRHILANGGEIEFL